MSTRDTAQLRTTLATTTRSGRGRAYPAQLRAEVVRHAAARIDAGESAATIASELGLCAATLTAWRKREGHAPSAFARVEVVTATAEHVGAIVVHGPRGLRIEGLSLDGIVALFRRLG